MSNDALDPAQRPAGPSLDAAVQRAVWGSDLLRIPTVGEPHHWVIRIEAGKVQPIPPYSTSIEAAWLIVERMRGHCVFELRAGSADRLYWARFHSSWVASVVEAIAETAPLAIVRAALSAVAMAPEGERGGE
jgi:hypothetical protein